MISLALKFSHFPRKYKLNCWQLTPCKRLFALKVLFMIFSSFFYTVQNIIHLLLYVTILQKYAAKCIGSLLYLFTQCGMWFSFIICTDSKRFYVKWANQAVFCGMFCWQGSQYSHSPAASSGGLESGVFISL